MHWIDHENHTLFLYQIVNEGKLTQQETLLKAAIPGIKQSITHTFIIISQHSETIVFL